MIEAFSESFNLSKLISSCLENFNFDFKSKESNFYNDFSHEFAFLFQAIYFLLVYREWSNSSKIVLWSVFRFSQRSIVCRFRIKSADEKSHQIESIRDRIFLSGVQYVQCSDFKGF